MRAKAVLLVSVVVTAMLSACVAPGVEPPSPVPGPSTPTPSVTAGEDDAGDTGSTGDPDIAEPVRKAYPRPTGNKVIHLTFDDGPWPGQTDRILSVLEAEGLPATFFMLGTQVKANPDLAKRLHMAGMSVQGHSWNHRSYSKISNAAIASDAKRTASEINKATGREPTCVRPPYGATNRRVRQALRSVGYSQVLWDNDSRDWTKPRNSVMLRTVLRDAKPGGIVLFHDGGGDRSGTIETLPLIIKALKKEGYEFAALCEPREVTAAPTQAEPDQVLPGASGTATSPTDNQEQP